MRSDSQRLSRINDSFVNRLIITFVKTRGQLRKALKFKAGIFLIAWATIFAHNVIPHNHVYDNTSSPNELTHNISSFSTDGDRTFKPGNEHSGSEACHLLNFLFHNLSPEAFLTFSFRDINFNPESQGTKIIADGDHSCISDHLKGSTCLRAPPVA